MKQLVRILSFAVKELTEVRRQPRLIASLILGPFLILLLFGVGYNSTQPPLYTVLVIPPGSGLSADPREYDANFKEPFRLSRIVPSRVEARRLIDEEIVDVAVIVPKEIVQTVVAGKSAQLELLYKEIDPVQGGWIPYFGNVGVTEVNRRVIEQAVARLQERTRLVSQQRSAMTAELDGLQAAVEAGNPDATIEGASTVERAITETETTIGELTNIVGSEQTQEVRTRLASGKAAAGGLRDGARDGQADPATQRELVARLRSDVDEVLPLVDDLNRIPPRVLAAPITVKPVNAVRYQPTFVAFFGPGVLALLLQHLALTLSSLSIVRERLLGALEIFRVAPVGKTELFFGKYLGYGIITLALGAILTVLMRFALKVPILGSLWYFLLSIALLILASLSLGFLVSTLSRSESQAVQLAMILLLASIFFSGFFLPLETLLPWVRAVSYVLPVTFGIISLQDVMLKGEAPEWWTLAAPLGIFLVALFLATRLLKRDLARA